MKLIWLLNYINVIPRQVSKVVESGSCCSSSMSTNGVIVNRGALEEEHTDDEAAKEVTENKDVAESLDGTLVVSADKEFVRGVRKQLGSLFSSDEDARKSSAGTDKREGAIGRKVWKLENPTNRTFITRVLFLDYVPIIQDFFQI